MRPEVAAVVLCACWVQYDPIDEIDHREFATARDAASAILEEIGDPRVYAVGEYHPSRGVVVRTSPLARFTREMFALLEPRAQHLVIEAWLDAACNGNGLAPIPAQISAVTGRNPSNRGDIDYLVASSREQQIHGIPMSCIEQSSLLDPHGRVDFYRLLELVTVKLGETTRAQLDRGHSVIVYGGALHNDLYPRWPLEKLSYARSLAGELGPGGVLEVDLVVPEIVAPLAMVRSEPWFPLLGRASPGRVIVWQRGAGSYVVILPAESEEVAKVAKPIGVM